MAIPCISDGQIGHKIIIEYWLYSVIGYAYLCNIWTFTIKKISDWSASLSFMLHLFHTSCTKWYILTKFFFQKKKSNKNFLWICTSTKYILINNKVSRNFVGQFRGVAITNRFSSKFNFGQISKFKRGIHVAPGKKIYIKISCKYAHLQSLSFITTKFHKILLSAFKGIALTNCFSRIFNFGQISTFKRGITPSKKMNQKFLIICTSIHHVLNHNVLWNSFLEELRWHKNQDWLTNWRTDGSKSLYPPQLFAWGIHCN